MEKTEWKPAETFKMIGNWESQSKQLKSKFPQLTDSDLKFETGMENELLSRIETRLKKGRGEVIGYIKKVQAGTVQSRKAKAYTLTHSL